MKILIGSVAMEKYVSLGREARDIDFFSDNPKPTVYDPRRVETFDHPALRSWFKEQDRFATLNELYTIKMSHIFWDLKNDSWEKHVHDLMTMKKAGAQLDQTFFDLLYAVWEDVHGKKQANLNALPEDFFNKNVKRIYDHDSIHASVAYNKEPMYKKILRDNHPVLVDMLKWKNLSLEEKFQTVREEVYATALERHIIPSGYTASRRVAYQWALKKTITSFSKGWFPLFIVNHLEELWSPDIDYVARHKANANKLIKLEK